MCSSVGPRRHRRPASAGPRACGGGRPGRLRCTQSVDIVAAVPCSRRARPVARSGGRRCRRRWRHRRRSRPARRTCCWHRSAQCAPTDGVVLVDAVVVGEDRAGADVGALADLGVADVRQVRDLRARADVGVLGLDERADLAAARRARCRGAGRRTGRRWRAAPITAPRPWVRTTLAPVADLARRSRVRVRADHGAGRRPSSRRAAGRPGRSVTSRRELDRRRRPRSWRGRRPRRPRPSSARACGG